jgi:hypothetical protein
MAFANISSARGLCIERVGLSIIWSNTHFPLYNSLRLDRPLTNGVRQSE